MSLLITAIQELTMENEMLHAENALKLTQILDLETIIWNLREPRWNDLDGSPCWCGDWNHSNSCLDARKATEPFWKKQEKIK